jgi:YbgC/YbaW family acyl-CoA thioester hydrolase
VVARQEVDYKSPAVYGDCLEVETRFTGVTAVRMVAEHRITGLEKKVICSGKTTLVCVDKEIKPRQIPEFIKEKLLQ